MERKCYKLEVVNTLLKKPNHVYAAEHYQLLQAVKKYPHLRKIIQAVQENKGIKMAVLFGSYAKGLAKKDIDKNYKPLLTIT